MEPPHAHYSDRMNKGVVYGLASAVLFGMSTPLAKTLVGSIPPLLLAGLLYAGAGVGLLVVLVVRRLLSSEPLALPSPSDLPWLGGAILVGGVLRSSGTNGRANNDARIVGLVATQL